MMDYSIDLEVLENSIKYIGASLEEIRYCQDRLFMTCWLLIRTGWEGESAERLGERSNELDGRFDLYQGRNESADELLRQLQTNAQSASAQASSLASIWGGGFLGSLGRIFSGRGVLGSGGGDVVGLNRGECGQVYSLCAQLNNLYAQQYDRISRLRSLYYSCNDGFGAISCIDSAGNEIDKVNEQIDQFSSRLKNYESFVGEMESSASAKASAITPAEPFKAR